MPLTKPRLRGSSTSAGAPTERDCWSRMAASTHLLLPLHKYVKQLVNLATSPLSSAFKSSRSATAGCGTQTGQPSLQQVKHILPSEISIGSGRGLRCWTLNRSVMSFDTHAGHGSLLKTKQFLYPNLPQYTQLQTSTDTVGKVPAMDKRPVQESQYNCTLKLLALKSG